MAEVIDEGSSGIRVSSETKSYRIGHAAELLGVSVDTVRRWADEGHLAVTRTAGGQRLVNGEDLARLATERADNPGEGRSRVSARNRFAGLVTRVRADELMAQVEIQAGPYRVVSLMTREAAEDLGLAAGVEAVAVVKATTVVVERPRT
ncbi:MAG: helix-turn-helix transcriptional regulator [bacterium]|nr:helix-turn-helix transcriptional regulator [bacterium]